MERTTVTTSRILTWSGLIPFAGLALIAGLGAPEWLGLLLTAYAALILSFMAGTLWTQQLLVGKTGPNMLIASNALVLAAWPAVLMPVHWASTWLGVLFAAHLLLEAPWRRDGLPGWYRHLRLAVSLAAIVLLLTGGLVGMGVAFNA